jgi:hypothetical protein
VVYSCLAHAYKRSKAGMNTYTGRSGTEAGLCEGGGTESSGLSRARARVGATDE